MPTLFILIASVLSFMISQAIKIALLLRKQTFNWRLLFLDGHFPSSHTAIVSSMTFGVYFSEGLSTVFIVCLILLLVTIRDAVGVRQQVGRLTKDARSRQPHLAPYQGHTAVEVLGGLVVGFLISFTVFMFI